jgi:hypothetical protein
MNKKEKLIIKSAVIEKKSNNYWGNNIISNYLRFLKTKCKDVSITANSEELKNRVFEWIEAADPSLEKFYEYHKLAEAERAKVVELLQLSDNMKNIIDAIISNFKEIAYDPYGAGDYKNPKIVYAHKHNSLIEIWLAVKADKMGTISLFPDDAIKQEIMNELHKKYDLQDIEDILKLTVSYIIGSRIINIIHLNVEEGSIAIAIDNYSILSSEDVKNEILPEERFGSILMSTLHHYSIQDEAQICNEIRRSENKKINKSTISNIIAFESETMLLIPYLYLNMNYDGDLTDEIHHKFIHLSPDRLHSEVSRYYRASGTFNGFLNANPQFDAENHSKDLQILRNSPSLQLENIAKGFVIFIHHNSDIIKGRVECNATNGSLKLFLDKGSNIYERIYKELDSIFSKYTK